MENTKRNTILILSDRLDKKLVRILSEIDFKFLIRRNLKTTMVEINQGKLLAIIVDTNFNIAPIDLLEMILKVIDIDPSLPVMIWGEYKGKKSAEEFFKQQVSVFLKKNDSPDILREQILSCIKKIKF